MSELAQHNVERRIRKWQFFYVTLVEVDLELRDLGVLSSALK
jgi:hypothetical protein